MFLQIRFGHQFKTAENLPNTYVVVANHTTDYDPLFVAAGEHFASWKSADLFLRFAFSPILPSTGKDIKSARCALVTYKIEKEKS